MIKLDKMAIKQFHLVGTFIIWCLFSFWIKCSGNSLGAVVINDHSIQVVKSQQHLGYFLEHLIKNLIKLMYTPNGTLWYPFCLVWSSITCFRPENVSYNWPITVSDKITTAPRLVSEHLIKKENNYQTMNILTKWNCLTPLLSSLVNYYLFQPWKC